VRVRAPSVSTTSSGAVQFPVAPCRAPATSGPAEPSRYPPPCTNADIRRASASLETIRTITMKITVMPPPWAAPPSTDHSNQSCGANSSPSGIASHSVPTRAMIAAGRHRVASSGTPSAPTTARIWNTDELAPDDAFEKPISSCSNVGIHAVRA
jgi:hypothetical protein